LKAENLPSTENKIIAVLKRQTVWDVLIVILILMAFMSEKFFTASNLLNILRQVSIVSLVAVGMTVVLMGGNFDLSVGATITLAAVVSVNVQPVTTGTTILSILLPLLLGLAVGAVNGFIIGWLKANSVVVTVGTQFAILGITLLYTGGQHVWVWTPTPFYENISGGYFLGVPNPVYIFVVVVIAAHLILTRTTFGRYIRAIGSNDEAARLAGIPTKYYRMLTFVFAGFTAALAGIVLASRVKNLDPTAGVGYEFIALTAAVLGGTRLTGGQGNVLKTMAGVLILGVISNSMVLLNISYNFQLLVRGLILLLAVAIDSYSTRQVR